MGLLSNIVASYLVEDLLEESFLGIPFSIWLILALLSITAISGYILVLTPEVTRAAIYTNIMVDDVGKCMHFSPHAPWAVQYAELLWKTLKKDGSPLAKNIIGNLKNAGSDSLTFDLIEHLIFQVLSGFEPFWASPKAKSYGYPSWPRRLGEIAKFRPSTVYVFSKRQAEDLGMSRIFRRVLGILKKDYEYKNFDRILHKNEITQHFLGSTSLEQVKSPENWLTFTPKGTDISIQYKEHERIIKLSNYYNTICLTLRKEAVGMGLPYGIRIREKNYDRRKYSSVDFRIDMQVSFSRLLSIHPSIDDYHNWARLVLEKLVANFSLSRREIIEGG